LFGVFVAACGGKVEGYAGGDGGAAGAGGAPNGGAAGESGGSAGATGGSGGDVGVGGASGAGGSSGGMGGTGADAERDMIDDMEDGDAQILWTEGRAGGWYAFNSAPDPDPAQFPPVEGPWSMTKLSVPRATPVGATSFVGAHCVASASKAHAGCGFDLKNWNGLRSPYDASLYGGITFWAKLGAGEVATLIQVRLRDANTDVQGGRCAKPCESHYAAYVSVTSEWKEFRIAWSELETPASAVSALLVNAIYAIEFAAAYDTPMDLMVDDVAFIR
jgi:hypothetical protein